MKGYLNLHDAVLRAQRDLTEKREDGNVRTQEHSSLEEQAARTLEITESGEARSWNYHIKDDSKDNSKDTLQEVELTI